MKIRLFRFLAATLLGASLLAPALSAADKREEIALETIKGILPQLKEKIRTEYYDPSFQGIPFNESFATAEKPLAAATSMGEALAIVAQTVTNLGDSHTRFLPPPRAVRVNYGWALQTVGDKVYVLAVKPGSDAEKQGVKPGERVVAVSGLPLNRETLPLARYLLVALNPQPSLRATLQGADGTVREVQFAAELTTTSRRIGSEVEWMRAVLAEQNREFDHRSHFVDLAPGVLLWKLASFSDEDDVTEGLRRAAKAQAVILDLRGNPGGRQEAMLDAIGAFLGHKEIIGQIRQRDRSETLVAESHHIIRAPTFVLIDANSSSAAEVLPRALQLASRATLLGDRTSGMVNQGRLSPLIAGPGSDAILCGVSVTTGALLMKDGQPLEKVGVTPDIWLLPSPKDLAAEDDRVLATAAKMAGVPLTKEQAGAISRKLRQPIYD